MASKGTVIVTGAGQGIGKGIALRLAKDGFDVAVNDIPANAENLAKVVDEIKSTGRASSAHLADVSVESEVKAMVEEVVRVYGGLDVMVANAGVCAFRRIIDMTADDWDRVMSINARGTFLCYKYAGLQMISQGRGGRIIGASSVGGKRGGAVLSAYSASKFAIRGLTQAAALEFGSHGITLKARAALPMIATPEDIAGLVSYMASKESQFITGVYRINPRVSNILTGMIKAKVADRHYIFASVFIANAIQLIQTISMPSKGTVIVTGAARGIGKAIALRLADDGFDVAVNDIANNAKTLALVVDEITAKGRASSVHVADVSSDDQVRAMVEQVVSTYGSLDVMVANAGVASYTPFPEMTADQWDHIMGVNARGAFLCYKYAGMQMIKQGNGGRIIAASSVFGKQGSPVNPAYTASKFAVRGLTQAAALEFGAHGITVNAYAPGAIDTDMLPAVAPNGTPYSDVLDQFKKASPLATVGTPADIANIVSFLASKESQFITGQTISVNGGTYFD
ncbi:hypothetical protein C8R44DRAFT_889117 [Mycena epipterygia]|nr:hypothetical protein C8R44DRAFT_889117 [Mycena epipterygia]